MVRRLLNRLTGRTGRHIDAMNAYVEGNTSDGEAKLVARMMRDNPALESDLSTQKALRDVLGRVGAVEAPRSFAITPEMVAAAAASDSPFPRIFGQFAPQRKLALAPIVLAGFAALTVALLTIGDITGFVEQSGGQESFSAASVTELSNPAAAGAPGSPGLPGASGAAGATALSSTAEDSTAGAAGAMIQNENGVEVESGGQPASPELQLADTAAPAATAVAPGAVVPESSPPALAALESSAPAEDADAAAPPGDGTAKRAFSDSAEITVSPATAGGAAATPVTGRPGRPGDLDRSQDAATATGEGATRDETTEITSERAFDQAGPVTPEGPSVGTGARNGVSLPIWQLQAALAGLIVASIGAWAGLRQVRRD